MRIILPLFLGLAILGLLLRHFLRTPAHDLARQLYMAAGIGLMAAGVGLLFVRQFALVLRMLWEILNPRQPLEVFFLGCGINCKTSAGIARLGCGQNRNSACRRFDPDRPAHGDAVVHHIEY